MKKRVSLELRHRSPTEVSKSRFVVFVYRFNVKLEPAGEEEHMAGCLQVPKSAQNECLLFKDKPQDDINSGRVFN